MSLTKEQKEGIRDLAQQDHANGELLWSGKSGLARWARATGEAGDSVTGEFLQGIGASQVVQVCAEVVYSRARKALLGERERKLFDAGAFDWRRAGPHGDTHAVIREGEACSS